MTRITNREKCKRYYHRHREERLQHKHEYDVLHREEEREQAFTIFRKWEPPKGGVKQWFADRGIAPTLAEYREVAACAVNGANPMGIH